MSVKLFLLAAVVAYASAQECLACSGTSTTGCPTGYQGACCNSKCTTAAGLLSVDYGGACSSSATACNQCKSGYTCTNSVCVLAAKSYNCACSGGDCASGMSCNSNLCGFTNIGVGGSCAAPNTCAAGLTCTNSICTAVPVGSTCLLNSISGNAVIKGADAASNCVATAYCNATIMDSNYKNYTCVTKLAAGTPIPQTACSGGLSNWCASGHCYQSAQSTPYTITCASYAPGPAASGEYCINDGQCASGLFCDTNSFRSGAASYLKCRAVNSLVLYERCSMGSTTECAAGTYCSLNNTVSASTYNCVSGTKNGLAAGASCYNNDQCYTAAFLGNAAYNPACVGSNANVANNVAGVCNTTVIGQSCSLESADNKHCYANGAAVSCTCANAVWTCTADATAATVCSTNYAAVLALYANRYPSIQSILAAGTAADQATYISYACCASCQNGFTSASTIEWAASAPTYWNRVLNCATLTSAAYSTTDETARCTNPRAQVWTAANVFGACGSANTSAGVSVFPSVALLFAVVAVLLSVLA